MDCLTLKSKRSQAGRPTALEDSPLTIPLFLSHRTPKKTLKRNLVFSTADATSFGVMVGVGETFLPAFALAVGLGEVMAGLVASIPLLVGGLLQLSTPYFLKRYTNRQLWVVGSAALQAMAFLPLVIAAIIGSIGPIALLFIASIYWACGLSSGPVWNSWIEQLVPRRVRAGYFAKRTRASQLATVCGFVGGGLLLQYGRNSGTLTTAFAILFATAFLFRIVSVVMLASHRNPQQKTVLIETKEAFSNGTLDGRKLLIYLVIVQGVVQISGPYFTPYMLKQMGLSYVVYTSLIATAFITKSVSLAAWGSFAKQRGAVWLLTVGGIGIIPLSSLWTLNQSIPWLLFVQALSGVTWAAYELGFFLLFFEALPRSRRIKMLTYYNFANTASWCMGATIGASVLYAYGATVQGYYTLFILSSIGRLLAMTYLLSHRPTVRATVTNLCLRVLGIRPSGEFLDSPILPAIPVIEESSHVASDAKKETATGAAA
jgi:MFS family permease